MGGIFGSNQTQTTNNNQQYSGQSTGDFSRTGTNTASYNPYGSPFLTNALNFAQPGIMSVTGAAAPYFGAAANMFGMAGQGPNVSQFLNPYAGAITANLKDLFGQQMSQVTGSLTQQAGGVGADRIAVGQSELAKQQGQVAAGALEQAYAPALQAALAQEQAQNTAGFGYTGLGTQSQYAALAPYQTIGNVTAQLAPALGGSQSGTQSQSGSQSQNTSGTQQGTATTQSQYNPSVWSDIGNVAATLGGFGSMGGGSGAGSFFSPFNTGNTSIFNPGPGVFNGSFGWKRGGKVDPHLEALADLHDSDHLRKLARGGYAGGGDIDASDITLNAGPGGYGAGVPWSPTNDAIRADAGVTASPFAPTGPNNFPIPTPRPASAPGANPYAPPATAANPYAAPHPDTGGFFPGLLAAGSVMMGHPEIAAGMVRGRQSIEQDAQKLDQLYKFHQDQMAHEQAQLEQSRQFHEDQYSRMTPYQTGTLQMQQQRYGSGLFSPETVDMLAEQALAGDKSVFANLGRGISGPQNIVQVRERMNALAKDRGYSGADIAALNTNFMAETAAARTAAVREANVQTSINEAEQTFPLARDASHNLPRGTVVPWNRMVQLAQEGTSDPRLAQFVTAIQGARTAYSQAMSRTGVNSVHAQQAADHLLSTVTSPESFDAVLDQMQKEMKAAQVAPEMTRQSILGRISGRPAGGTAAAPAQPPATPALPQPGEVRRGYRFLGGDASKQENWQAVQ